MKGIIILFNGGGITSDSRTTIIKVGEQHYSVEAHFLAFLLFSFLAFSFLGQMTLNHYLRFHKLTFTLLILIVIKLYR